MQDKFAFSAETVSAASRSVVAVTLHDSNALASLPKALYVGTGGDVTLRCVDDQQDVTFRNVPSGGLIRARAAYVRATGTTASNILAHL